MLEISPNAIITILRDQAKKSKQIQKKNKHAKDAVYCLQHTQYLKKIIDRDNRLRKARKVSTSRKHHLQTSHYGGAHDGISNLKIHKPDQINIMHEE